MGSETSTETDAPPLAGAVPAQDANGPHAAAPLGLIFTPAWREQIDRLLGPPRPPPAKPSFLSRLGRLWRRWFVRFDPNSIPVGQPLTKEQLEMLDRCQNIYIDKGNEYEPAPGRVCSNSHFHNGMCWTHGNFVARKKRSGWFSFLPAPRTLFFFELAHVKGYANVITCTPLVDCFCKTCYSRFDVLHPGIQKIFACGHKHVEKVCEMCYLRIGVLHPHPGGFAFGYHDPYRPYPTKH
ncbi:hypothetical protein HU200_004482 [Digitaria exilis]|uniref:DUF3615 domain-containing protein n=1 Tax=Digitaria exilis TaxID=1010633 RepID=A0A835KV12_9POAL|nr:hypothetical protein HU200_004482 [Digitaria exilis]